MWIGWAILIEFSNFISALDEVGSTGKFWAVAILLDIFIYQEARLWNQISSAILNFNLVIP